MKISPKIYAAALYQLLKDVEPAQRKTAIADFLSALSKTPDKILAEFEKYADEQGKIKRVTVTSAHPLSEKLRSEIKTSMAAKISGGKDGGKIEMVEKINPELIGGVVISWDDQTIDLSVRNRVKQLKEQLVG